MEHERVNDYLVCTAKDAKDLTRVVNEKIGDGWQPIGGVSVGNPNMLPVYGQAMVWPSPR